MSAAAHHRRKRMIERELNGNSKDGEPPPLRIHAHINTMQGENATADTAASPTNNISSYQNTGDNYHDNDNARPLTGILKSPSHASLPHLASASSSPIWPPRGRSYRGFSTSICDMFHSRYDCCAFACCGILSFDRTRYLLTGERPPSIAYRVAVHFMIPLLIFVVAGFCALNIADHDVNEIVSALLIMLLISYIVSDCVQARRERISQRRDILERVGRRSEQTDTDIRAAHGTLCVGCYTTDGHWDHWGGEDQDTANEATTGVSTTRTENNICTIIWGFFAKLCCGVCTGYFFQICGICALAQEAREMERLVEPRDGWVDYVTFEPFSNFFHKIVALRITENNNLMDHYESVSKLSRLLIKTLNLVVLSLVFLSFMNFNTLFTYQNVLVLIATFFQAFVILYLVHWKWNKFDLSLDAIIKYFASGFLLTTGVAIFFEMIMSMSLQLLLSLIIAVTGGIPDSGDATNTPQGTSTGLAFYGVNHPAIVIMYLFLNSFTLAAFVEETSKYFGYLMVTHPDFMTEEAQLVLDSNQYPDIEETHSDESNNDGGETDDEQQQQHHQQSPKEEAQPTLTAPERSLNSIGTGITVAMVSVALGFSCCENLLYIFIYTGDDVGSEISVLIARSLFPIHPLAAAIQSIGVCRRVLEKEESAKLGRITLPAIILHGSFNFALMVSSFLYDVGYAKLKTQGGNADEDYGTGAVAFLLSFGIVVLGFGYYFTEASKQRSRLSSVPEAAPLPNLV